MMTDLFQRTKLLLGDDGFRRLCQAHVMVVGCGAVGGFAVEALARAGIGKLTLIDGDQVEESNINRQLCALHSTIRQFKTEVLKNRIEDICPETQVQTHPVFLSEDNAEELLTDKPDFVIDAIDQMKIKAMMANHFVQTQQAFAVSGGAGGQRHPEKIHFADLSDVRQDKLLANMRYQLRRAYQFPRQGKMRVPCVYSEETVTRPAGENCALQGLSCAGFGASMMVTATFGLFLASTAIEHIAKQS